MLQLLLATRHVSVTSGPVHESLTWLLLGGSAILYRSDVTVSDPDSSWANDDKYNARITRFIS